MNTFLRTYGKTIVAALTAGLVALQAAQSDSVVTGAEWVAIVVAALGAVGVFFAPAITKANEEERGKHEAPPQ